MKRPEIIGWEVTTNENGIKMATLPRDTMEEIVKYIEYADKQLRLADVRNLLIAWEQYEKANWWESEAINVEQHLIDKFIAINGY